MRYRAGGETRTELSGRSDRGWVCLEWQEDHPVFSFSMDDQNRTLSEIGLSQADLARLNNEASPDTVIEVDGRVFSYEGGGKVRRFTKRKQAPHVIQTWEFNADDGKGTLSIEQFGDDPPEVSVGTWIHPRDVEVRLRTKKKDKRKYKRR